MTDRTAPLPPDGSRPADGGPLRAVDELAFAGVPALRRRLERGELSAAELAAESMRRIAELDADLRAVIEVNPQWSAEAERQTARRADESVGTRPLAGIPVLVKDNIDTAAPMHTTAGSFALAADRPRTDAPLVTALRAAGAVVLGKTNLSEWSHYLSSSAASGWSAVGGLTVNPHDRTRSAGGSSSGSAAALAAGYVPLTVGTETNGSISCPASLCGVVGLKPTVGLIPRTGIVPISATQDTAGPMGRSVADVATLLGVLAGIDADDPMTRRAGRPDATDYQAAARPGRLAGVRIGVPHGTNLFGYHRGADELALAAVDVLADLGAQIVDDVPLPGLSSAEELVSVILDHELKAGLARYLAGRPRAPQTLAELIAFNTAHAEQELRWFDQDLFERAQAAGGVDSVAYVRARAAATRAATSDGIDYALSRHRLDALAMPCFPPAWTNDLSRGDDYSGGCSTLPAVAGYPLLSVPCGAVAGPSGPLPVAVAFTAGAWSEPTLLRIAAAYEAGAER